jgi:hypothetical protein
MTVYRATTIFDAWRTLAALLEEATYPPHPVTGEQPSVGLGLVDDRDAELVRVVTSLGSASDEEWRTMGGVGKREEFDVQVAVVSAVAGTECADAVDRLQELVDATVAALRDLDTGDGHPAELNPSDPGRGWWSISGIEPTVAPLDEGWGGEAVITVRVTAFI